MPTLPWGLTPPEPASGIASQLFYAGEPQQEALARLRFLAQGDRRLGVLLGEPGVGKSLLCELFAAECRSENMAVAAFSLVGLSVRELLWELAARLEAVPQTGEELPALQRRVDYRLRQNQILGQSMLWLLDDADQAGADTLTQITRLVQLPSARVGKLCIVLTLNPTQALRLGNRLLDLIDLRIELEPWDEADTESFLQLAQLTTGSDQRLFATDAVAEIQRLSGGVPRRVHRLADFALLAGSSAGHATVDAELVAAAHAELSFRWK